MTTVSREANKLVVRRFLPVSRAWIDQTWARLNVWRAEGADVADGNRLKPAHDLKER